MRVVSLVKKNITPRKIMTREAFENAIMVDMALGGSTNTALHIPAIAHETCIELSLETFDTLSRRTPHITNMIPGGIYYMEDLHNAGGISAVLKRLEGMGQLFSYRFGAGLLLLLRGMQLYWMKKS